MAITYQPIATYTAGSAVASYEFTSIPQTYTDLILVSNSKNSAGAVYYVALQFNGDTASNYSTTGMWGDGSTASSLRWTTTITGCMTGWNSNTNNTPNIVHIQNYTNTTTSKTVLSRGSDSSSSGRSFAGVSLWRKTPEAITSIKIFLESPANFAAGSTFTLYGIKAA